MTLDVWKFKNPALTVRYESEMPKRKPRCVECHHYRVFSNKPFCDKGRKMDKPCVLWKGME